MSWCEEHLKGCVFGADGDLRSTHCPEERGESCTLVHVILAVHRMPPEIRRKLIAALYPAYGIEQPAEGSALSPSPPLDEP